MEDVDLTYYFGTAIRLVEQFLAVLMLIAIAFFIVINITNFNVYELGQDDTIVKLISDVLLLILGVEVTRLLIAPSVKATVELLIYVIARKALSPNATASDLLFNAMAFAIILAINYIFLADEKTNGAKLFPFGKTNEENK